MIREITLQGLSLKVGPLGENDRLLTLLTAQEGIARFAVPGARKPKSSLSAAAPLTFLELLVGGKSSLRRIRQIKVLRSFSKLGEKLESLSAAQAFAELSLLLVGNNDPQPEILKTILIHLARLENPEAEDFESIVTLAICVQSCIHLLALGGYGIPVQRCCITNDPLEPPLGNWDWKCSLIPESGIKIGHLKESKIILNASELALLQILFKQNLPIKKNGDLLGPKETWLKLLKLIEIWVETHLNSHIHSLEMLRKVVADKNMD